MNSNIDILGLVTKVEEQYKCQLNIDSGINDVPFWRSVGVPIEFYKGFLSFTIVSASITSHVWAA
ncbi:hypothetical protein [Bacillus sp. AFS055030]|uniref:hypothetical protein n=1 Tax=Bacillus sp. AFS055030 TaxID=2033507 RepID=UPI000BFCB18A|nr:hypothetical protein [Bacillus sp. AFS055030]PGL66903.1 hypothetical protein CN925_20540 [Bacillus sp. AFS055030]